MKHISAPKKRALAPLSPRVYETFFDAEILRGLRRLLDLRVEVAKPWDGDRYARLLAEYAPEIIITGWESPRLEASFATAAAGARVLLHTAGAVRAVVDREYLESGLAVANWGHTMAPSVAEGTLMMILASLRRVPHYHELMHRERGWKVLGGEYWEGLFGRTVGLHGFGQVARSLTQLMRPFDCKVSAYSPHVPDSLLAEFGVARAKTLEELHAGNHLVVNLASATPENRHIVDAPMLSRLRDGGHYILTGRGATVDTEALVRELQSGRIFAALDVYEVEPLPAESPLRGLRNCLLIPHMAGPTPDRYRDMGRLVLENVKNYLAGKPLVNQVPASQYELMT